MSYSWKRKLADYFADHPSVNKQALAIYQSLEEVNRLINPPETEHTKKETKNTKQH